MLTREQVDILRRYFNGIASKEEKEWLMAYVMEEKNSSAFQAAIKDIWLEYSGQEETFTKDQSDKIFNNILSAGQSDVDRVQISMHSRSILKSIWFKYAAAIIIVFGTGAYLWNNFRKEKSSTVSSVEMRSTREDILPGSQRAMLTLSDGHTIELDTAANGQLAAQGNTNILKKDGLISYENDGFLRNDARNSGVAGGLNIMSTPKGGQYQLTLADGTKVWLNAASKITYPTAFKGRNRIVEVSGEAYFEIAKRARQPFIVKTAKEEITVLGTSFNVNAYTDEPAIKTTLVEGSVRIKSTSAIQASPGTVLKSGEAYANGAIIKTNIQQDIAWKNGSFNFHKLKLAEVMRQLGRWYDLNIVYEKGIPDITLGGEMGRDLNLSEVLDILSGMRVRCRLEGRKLIVLN